MKKIIFFMALSLFYLLISGCVPPVELKPVANPEEAWVHHQSELKKVDQWDLSGKLSVTDESQAQFVNFEWQQNRDRHYSISLSGPLGVGQSLLKTEGNKVVLTTPQGRFEAQNAAGVMQEVLGWSMPVDELKGWIIGLPGPNAEQVQLNPGGYIESFKENGWQVQYLHYAALSSDLFVPDRIRLQKDPFLIKVAIFSWRD